MSRSSLFANVTRRELIGALGWATGSRSLLAASPVRVADLPDGVEIENDVVKARFRSLPEGIEQEYFARAADRGWVLVAKAFRCPKPRPQGTAPLYSDTDVANEYRLLVTEALRTVEVAETSGERVRVVLTGSLGANRIEQSVLLSKEMDHFHVEVRAVLAEPRLEYLLSSFAFHGESPDFCHAPCVKRAADNVIGDRVFHSPAVLVRKKDRFAALAPDLDLLNESVVLAREARPIDGTRGFRIEQAPETISMPLALDLELKSGMTALPLLSYGYLDFITEQHVYWRHENRNGALVRKLSTGKLAYGFDLFVGAGAPGLRDYSRITRHQWRRYGSRCFRRPKPQTMPFEEYAKVSFPAAFAYKGDAPQDTKRYSERKPYNPDDSGPLPTWLDFELGGRPVGGIRATPSQWYNDVQFMAWWNNARLAVGFHWWGRHLDASLTEKARKMIALALAAPRNQGIFPAVYNYKERRWAGCYWKPAPPYQPSVLPKYWDFNSDYYQCASASKTAAYLLRYNRLCEKDARILPYVRAYGGFIGTHLDPNGCLPAWFTSDLKPVQHLRFNGEGGIHIWFLAELFLATRDRKHLDAAERLAGFLIREILPQHRWYDFETFYSCASKPEATFDPRTGQWPRCTLSMIWAIDGFTALYDATRKPEYLKAAESVADYAAFYQAVWQPHFIITAYVFGGYASQNSDAEWLDMRQAQFGEAMVRFGLLAGRQDALERGAAAVRSAFAVVNHPRHIQNGVFPTPSYPLGITAENIDHEGLPQLPLRSGCDWGECGALSSAAELLRLLGGVHIDFARKLAVGTDGVYVEAYTLEGNKIRVELENQIAALPVPYRDPYSLELSLAGLRPGRYELTVNGGPPRAIDWTRPSRIQIEMKART